MIAEEAGDRYDVEILDGRICYVHKNRHVCSLLSLCVERVSTLVSLFYPGFDRRVARLPSDVLTILLDHLASRAPLRSLDVSAAKFLLHAGRVQDLVLERLLMRHRDLRELLAALDTTLLRRITIVNVSCKCQEPPHPPTVQTECRKQYTLDEEALGSLVRDAHCLKSLDTTLPFDLQSLTSHPELTRLSLRWVRDGDGPAQSKLSARDLQALLLQLPKLQDLQCDIVDAILQVSPDVEPLLSRLSTVFLGPPTGETATDALVRMCPHAEEVTVHVSSSRDLQPLRQMSRLRKLTIRYSIRSGPNAFLNDTMFEALGPSVCGALQELELPLQARLRPQSLSAACPQLRVLVARSFFRPAVHEEPYFQNLQVLKCRWTPYWMPPFSCQCAKIPFENCDSPCPS
ncbi:uncharacterized protein LOC135392677 isoform X2 [Ornithodoros turicata]|uniref:uncharacterized protein LOC135392677 isoform X2 n=1 Tax=Ornithodoros turicata TaxID=34597 RepID=UPI003139263A